MTETNEWGSGTWGTGVWGTQLALSSDQRDIIIDNWPFQQVTPSPGDATDTHVRTIGLALDRLNTRIDTVSEQQRIDTATDEELTTLAGELNIVRNTGESDERLRFRARIAKAATRSQGTINDFLTVLAIIFGESVVESFGLSSTTDQPVVQLTIPGDILDNIPLTDTELKTALEPAIPATDTLQILSDDTFIFGESGEQGLGQGELL